MSTQTPNMGLFKYDPATDGSSTFNIQQALNDNWDRLDDAMPQKADLVDGKVPAAQLPEVDLSSKADAVHAHGQITSDGKIGSTANKAVYTGTGGALQAGTLPVSAGGTGATTAAAARNALGLGNTVGALPVANGGTGATTAAAARANLQAGMPYAYTLTIPTSGWTTATVGYTQTMTLSGITADMTPTVDVVQSTDAAAAKLQLEAWACISRIVTGAGQVTIYCYDELPQVAIPVQFVGVI